MRRVIRGGTIIDGSGRDAFVGDVVVEGDRIAEIVPHAGEKANGLPPQEGDIEATGCLVTPGFIDAHAHSDAYLVLEPDAPSKISQGITTEINGQCGGSIAPRYGEARLSSDWAALLGERLTWHSIAEYREVLARARPAINTVQFVGHNTLRSSVMGYAGRACDEMDLEKMKYLLEEALDEGAFGLSTGLIYQPGKYATNEEVVELAQVAAKCGGFYATHIRSEGDRILEAIEEVLSLVRRTGIRAEISHLKTSGKENWGKIDRVLETIDEAVRNGVLLGSDRYPFCASGTDLDVVFPDWAGEGAAKAECERLADPGLRRRIADEINASGRDWSSVMIGGTWHPDNKAFSGRRVDEIATEQGLTPGELVCEILAKDGCKTGAFFFVMNENNLDRILAQDWIVPGSDASLRAPWGPLGEDHPHPRAYATMPEFYRRARTNPLLDECARSRERIIRRMTAEPARRFGLEGRGLLARGAFADIAVWKEDEFVPMATYTEPHQFSGGVKCVMVNGTVPYADGTFTGERGGQFLERTDWR